MSVPHGVLVASTSPTTNAHLFEQGQRFAFCGRDIKGWPVVLHAAEHARMWCFACMQEAVRRAGA